jgi:hypothetical protein
MADDISAVIQSLIDNRAGTLLRERCSLRGKHPAWAARLVILAAANA